MQKFKPERYDWSAELRFGPFPRPTKTEAGLVVELFGTNHHSLRAGIDLQTRRQPHQPAESEFGAPFLPHRPG